MAIDSTVSGVAYTCKQRAETQQFEVKKMMTNQAPAFFRPRKIRKHKKDVLHMRNSSKRLVSCSKSHKTRRLLREDDALKINWMVPFLLKF
jgi:hypothetical protein